MKRFTEFFKNDFLILEQIEFLDRTLFSKIISEEIAPSEAEVADLDIELSYRLNTLIDTIKSRVPGASLKLESIILIDETRVRLVLQINGKIAEDYYFNL